MWTAVERQDQTCQYYHIGKCWPSNVNKNEPRPEKTSILVSEKVQHKPGCTATEADRGLQFFDLGSRGIVLTV